MNSDLFNLLILILTLAIIDSMENEVEDIECIIVEDVECIIIS